MWEFKSQDSLDEHTLVQSGMLTDGKRWAYLLDVFFSPPVLESAPSSTCVPTLRILFGHS